MKCAKCGVDVITHQKNYVECIDCNTPLKADIEGTLTTTDIEHLEEMAITTHSQLINMFIYQEGQFNKDGYEPCRECGVIRQKFIFMGLYDSKHID